MAVVRVWQVEPLDEMLMPGHEAVGYSLTHERARAGERRI